MTLQSHARQADRAEHSTQVWPQTHLITLLPARAAPGYEQGQATSVNLMER